MSPGRRLVTTLVALTGLLALVAAGSLFVGSAPVTPAGVLRAIAGRADPGSVEHVVTLGLRLPRLIVAALAGGALAVAGVGFQALTRNPLAEPSILGVSSGAAFGVVLAQVFGLGGGIVETLGVTAFAFAGAVVAAGAVYLIASGGRASHASAHRGLVVQTLLLAGVIVGVFFSAAITVLISIVDVNRLGAVVHWLLGNLAPVPPGTLVLFALLGGVGFWLIAGQARALNLLALGEEAAAQLGVATERLKIRIFVGAALLTATVVAFSGPIGFVGLIVPHLLRGMVGHDNRLLVPTALVAGGVFLLAADTVARSVVAPAELAVGVITSFCGAPFFIYVLRARVRTAP